MAIATSNDRQPTTQDTQIWLQQDHWQQQSCDAKRKTGRKPPRRNAPLSRRLHQGKTTIKPAVDTTTSPTSSIELILSTIQEISDASQRKANTKWPSKRIERMQMFRQERRPRDGAEASTQSQDTDQANEKIHHKANLQHRKTSIQYQGTCKHATENGRHEPAKKQD